MPAKASKHAAAAAFRVACRTVETSYTPRAAKHTIAALRGLRRLTEEQRKAWSQNMGHETETITDTCYGKLSDERCEEVFEEMGDEDGQEGTRQLSEEEAHELRAVMKGLQNLARRFGVSLADRDLRRTAANGANLTGWLLRRCGVTRPAVAPVVPRRAVPMPFPDPLRIRDVRLDCAGGYVSSGFTGCTAEVDVAVDIPPPYGAFAADSVRIRCDAELHYRARNGLFQQSGSGWTTRTVHPSFESGRGTLLLDLTFGFTTAPVVSPGIDGLSCRPD